MSLIKTTKFTEKLSKRLADGGVALWVAQTTGDTMGKFLLFRVGGACVAGCGWTQGEAEWIVAKQIDDKNNFDKAE